MHTISTGKGWWQLVWAGAGGLDYVHWDKYPRKVWATALTGSFWEGSTNSMRS